MESTEFQVAFNSKIRSIKLQIVAVGPRGKLTPITTCTRMEAKRLYNDLGAAIRMMDTLHEHVSEDEAKAAYLRERYADEEMPDEMLAELDSEEYSPAEEADDQYSRELEEKRRAV